MSKINNDGSFEELSESEITELYNWCHSVVVDGVIPSLEPAIISSWHMVMNTPQYNRLLSNSTVLPIKILMAIATVWKEKISELNSKLNNRVGDVVISAGNGCHHGTGGDVTIIGGTIKAGDAK